MNPDIKKSIINIIEENLVYQPARNCWQSVEYKENAQSRADAQSNQVTHSIGGITVTETRQTPAQSKARSIKSAIRRIFGKKAATPAEKPENANNAEYTCTTLLTMDQRPERYNGITYTLIYNDRVFEQRTIHQEQETLTPAQQDIIDIREAFIKQYESQLKKGYGPKMSAQEMMMIKYLKSLQK